MFAGWRPIAVLLLFDLLWGECGGGSGVAAAPEAGSSFICPTSDGGVVKTASSGSELNAILNGRQLSIDISFSANKNSVI